MGLRLTHFLCLDYYDQLFSSSDDPHLIGRRVPLQSSLCFERAHLKKVSVPSSWTATTNIFGVRATKIFKTQASLRTVAVPFGKIYSVKPTGALFLSGKIYQARETCMAVENFFEYEIAFLVNDVECVALYFNDKVGNICKVHHKV